MSKKKSSTVNVYAAGQIKQGVEIAAEQEQKKYFQLPVSSHTDMMHKVLGAGAESLYALPEMAEKVGKGSQSLTVRQKGSRRQVIAKGHNTETVIEVNDIDKILGSNKAAKKMLQFVLIKINEQAYDFQNGLHDDCITFPLQELVDTGNYKRIQSARRGFKDSMDVLSGLKVKASIKGKKNNETVTADALAVLFPTATIVNGQCSVRLNTDINWQPLMKFFTILPRFAFVLSNRAFDMLYSIVFLARQHAGDIEKKGYFKIGFRTIQQRLELPSEVGNKDPQRTIRQPLEDAIGDIMEQLALAGQQEEMSIIPVYNPKDNIRDYMDNGYLKVEIKGDFAQPFIERSETQTRKIEQRKRRQQAIVEKAAAAALQKKMEEEQKQKGTEAV